MMRFSLHRKWQEANQKIQELQASQEVRADQEQRIKVSCSGAGPGLSLGDVPVVGPAVLPAEVFLSWGRAQRHLGTVSCLCPL